MRHSTVQDENLKKAPKVVEVDGVLYEEAPKVSVVASKWLVEVWEKLGRPKTPFSKSGEKLMDVIIAVWQDLYPIEADKWTAERAEYQKNELTISQQIHRQTGRSLASFPLPIFKMMKKLFPGFKIGERNNAIKLVRKWEMFRFCNRV